MAGDLDDILRAYDPEERPITTQDVIAHTPQPSWFERNAGPAIDMWRNAEAGLANATQQFNQRAAGDLGRLLGRHIEPEEMAGVNALIGGVKAPGQPVRIPNPIKAFHGSPYDFNQFDISKIGSGEGAQAYGHGLYFAENPSVAQTYKSPHIDVPTVPSLNGKPVGQVSTGNKWLDQELASGVYRSADHVRSVLAGRNPGGDINHGYLESPITPEGLPPATRDILRRLDELDQSGQLKFPPPGRMYEVALHATPESFLNWDKPLSEQPQTVKDVVASFPEGMANNPDMTGAGIVRGLQTVTGSPNETALTLGREGIPGIRYLDQLSRGMRVGPSTPANDIARQWMKQAGGDRNKAISMAEQFHRETGQDPAKSDAINALKNWQGPTHNYSVWSPEIIEILRKYGLIPPVAAAALYGHGGDEQ